MSVETILFVTGKLAESALRKKVSRLADEYQFRAEIAVLPITVAALMTPEWISRKLKVPQGIDRVIVPGYCHDVSGLEKIFSVPFEIGPRDLRNLDEHFGGKQKIPDDYGAFDIRIIAEINLAPRMSLAEFEAEAQCLAADGADMIDVGCDPGSPSRRIGDYFRCLRDLGLAGSVDSFDPGEIHQAIESGAELVLSVNSTNREFAADWGAEVVVIPDTPTELETLDETVEYLQKRDVRFRLDPILEPIGCGFATSLQRYTETRARYPDIEMMMGTGNLTELTDVDSAGVNFLLLGICQELGIRSILTTEVINWARTSVRECDLARRMVHYAVGQGVPPKRLDDRLVVTRDAKLLPVDTEALAELARKIRDPNFRIFADGQSIHALGARKHFQNEDPFELFDEIEQMNYRSMDVSHAFYLGFEMCKALIANQLGKNYEQDESLNWGYLTANEKKRHRLARKRPKEDPPES